MRRGSVHGSVITLGRFVLGVVSVCALLFAAVSAAPAAQVQVQGAIVYDTFTYTDPNPFFGGDRCSLTWYVQFTQVPGATSALATLTNSDTAFFGPDPLEYPATGAPPWNTVTHHPTAGVEIERSAPAGMSWIPLDAFDTPGFGSCATTLAETQGRWTLLSLQVDAVPTEKGSITIVKETEPAGDAQSFSFTGSGPIGAFTLDTNTVSPDPDRRTFQDLEPGSYTVAESLPDGWQLADISCADPSGGTTTEAGAARATIALEGEETVTCTFLNRKAGPLVVNSVADTGEAEETQGDGACDTGATISRDGQDEPECTLRAALQEADANPDADTINFDVPGSGPAHFTPGLELPELKGPDVIDGETQPQEGCTAPSCVVIAPSPGERELYPGQGPYPGFSAKPFTFGVIGDGATVRGLTFEGPGVVFVSGRNHTLERNESHSLLFLEADDSSIVGNLLDANPQGPAGTCQDGAVRVEGNGNRIGGPDPASGNTIRGSGAGLWVFGSDTSIRGNWIDSNGLGIAVGDTGGLYSCHPGPPVARRTTIDSNVLSNNGTGIHIESNSEGTVVTGNRIGTDQTGLLSAPNDFGISVWGPAVIGGRRSVSGPCVSPCNLISSNGLGIYVAAFDDVLGVGFSYPVTIQGNTIGPDINGQPLPLPPLGDGIHIAGGSGVVVGGTEPGDGNLIAYNSEGVVLESLFGDPSTGHRIRGNRIFSNRGLGIDLVAPFGREGDGVTPNDFADLDKGPNGLQNFPEWHTEFSILVDGAVRIDGRVPINATAQGTYQVDVYLNSSCDAPLGNGEGEIYYTTVTTTDFADGWFQLEVPLGLLNNGRVLTATATAPDGSTSEFSACLGISSLGTALTENAAAGSTELSVGSTDGLIGKVLDIGSGATKERNYGDKSGSLILARPTRFAHAAGEPIVALDDTLFVSVDGAVITRFSWLPDLALLSGRLEAVAGRSIACGDDLTLTLGDTTVAQRLPGTKFVPQRGNRCVFVAATTNGIGRFELDLGKGTWNAQVIRRDLERLTNPLNVGLTIGDDSGSETLDLRGRGAIWTYNR